MASSGNVLPKRDPEQGSIGRDGRIDAISTPSSSQFLTKKQRNVRNVLELDLECSRAIKLLSRFVGKSKDEIAQFRLGNFSARRVAG
jgi:hypothetical protein